MPKIAIDMFAVELGLSVLLQFQQENGAVAVLADAGSKKHNVYKKLDGCLTKNDKGKIRIDLMIGTHYDGDHLNGLVDVIEREDVEIGEAWLPPVANDTEARLASQEPQDENMLGLQFARPGGDAVLDRYVRYKANTCEDASALERQFDDLRGIERKGEASAGLRQPARTEVPGDVSAGTSPWNEVFRAHLADAYETLGIEPKDHAALEIRSPVRREMSHELGGLFQPNGRLSKLSTGREYFSGSMNAKSEQELWAHVRVSAAKDAINALALAKVVNALKHKGVKTRYAAVDDGKPRRFSWDAIDRRFTPVSSAKTGEPSFVLLGPSRGLIKAHWDKLPVGSYAYAKMFEAVPYEKITPSNELSYVGVFEYAGQRLLISGDAGCVDFKPSDDDEFYPDLTAQLGSLDIIQIAHHAGHNAHFYNSLLASDFLRQTTPAYLLLSHGTFDKHRPSHVFGRFIEELNKDADKIQLVFTSTPTESKVRDFKHLIAPVSGTQKADESGDVKLEFDGADWKIVSHHVEVS